MKDQNSKPRAMSKKGFVKAYDLNDEEQQIDSFQNTAVSFCVYIFKIENSLKKRLK